MNSKQAEAHIRWIRGARRLVHPRRYSKMHFNQGKRLLNTLSRRDFRAQLQSDRLQFCTWLQEKIENLAKVHKNGLKPFL